MDSKRKANGAGTAENEDRSAKRRKTSDFDLSKGESADSTTAYGLTFLDQIRRTSDKNGRKVATYFEKLLPKQGNADYYRHTRMPISLEIIEKKLNNGEFKNLSELESYCKRMIANAKEYYPRSSSTFDDAERIRKALSNYMTKTNPAYNTRGYQAFPTPLPEDGENAEAHVDGEAEGDEDAEDGNEDEDGVENEDKGDEEPNEAEEAKGDQAQEDGDAGEEEDAEDDPSRKRSIILKRRGPGRPPRNSVSMQDSPRASTSTRPDHQYEDVPYKGLSFQQAQEKVVEEILRHKEPEYDDAYFEPFINLPPRSLRDYYQVIKDPLSIKKLQKAVKGIHGRNDVTGVSDFKSWAQFEEKSKLLWENAYFYNEEGSEIYELAQELEQHFYKQFKEAQAVVPEPAQPKIKLKVGQAETPSSSKKITIHVGRGGSSDSPAPQAQASESPASNAVNGAARPDTLAQLNLAPLEKARSVSLAAASPSPSMQAALKTEESAQSPAGISQPADPAGQSTPGQEKPTVPPTQSQAALMNGFVEPKKLRAEGKGRKDALIRSLRIQAYQTVHPGPYTLLTILPDEKEMQSSATVNVDPSQSRITIVVTLPSFLQDRQFNFWLLGDRQPLRPFTHQLPHQQPQEHVFEMMLRPGINVIEGHLVAAIPKSERVEGATSEVEVEVFTALVNVMRP